MFYNIPTYYYVYVFNQLLDVYSVDRLIFKQQAQKYIKL